MFHHTCDTCGQMKCETPFCHGPMRKVPSDEFWDGRIDEAANTILCCWNDWDAIAQQDEQQSQESGVWIDEMLGQIRAVLEGMVFDRAEE